MIKGREPVSMRHIRKVVSEHYGLSVEQICQDSNARCYVRPRQVAMYFLRKFTRASLQQTARFFGKKDHTTVHYAQRVVAARMEEDSDFEDDIFHLQDKILQSPVSWGDTKTIYNEGNK